MKFLIPFAFIFSIQALAEVIFVDLNDAKEEIAHCRRGVKTNNPNEDLHVVTGMAGKKKSRSNTYHALRAKIIELRERNIPIDSIVISGDDGSGNFFGSLGNFKQFELKELLVEFPDVGKSLTTAAVWGCYETSVHAGEQYWLNQMPNMQFTMGFVKQGPLRTRPANHILLSQFCERREEAARAVTMDQLCHFYDSIQQLAITSMGVCNRQGVVSSAYAKGGEKCFTYREMHRRCPEFINKPDLLKAYDKYMSGEADPPDEVVGAPPTDLREFYDEAQAWNHCASKFKTERGFDLPYPPNVVRLIKYNKVKANLMKRNKTELREYDEALDRAGLGALKLGDITHLSRKTVNERIEAAVAALEGQSVEVPASQSAPAKAQEQEGGSGSFMFSSNKIKEVAQVPARYIRASKDPVLLRMAQCARMTLVNMDYTCIPFDLVGDRPTSESLCLMGYNEAKERHPDDAC